MKSETTLPESVVRVSESVQQWFSVERRELPWRGAGVDPWAVMVSEFMLQQTPVARVLPVWREWLARWPTPADCAGASLAEVITQWGRLGYPRRAKRLHACAQEIVDQHGGVVPGDEMTLRSLPGVGEYTAAAIACFAFGHPTVVVDTNIRRVHARVFSGRQYPDRSYSAAERALATRLVDQLDVRQVPGWNIGVMELGALVCTAKAPKCEVCPLKSCCGWVASGCPESSAPRRLGQDYYGTDRYVRGLVLGLARDAGGPCAAVSVSQLWADQEQLAKAVASLIQDGLLVRCADGQLSLPV